MNWEDVVALNRRSPASLSRLLSFRIEVGEEDEASVLFIFH